jgi:hypothetical protein
MINNAGLTFAKTSCDELKIIFEAFSMGGNAIIGDMTLSIMTLSIMTLSIRTFSSA